VRRPARNGPKTVDAAPSAAVVTARTHTEYSDLVDLARRMSIPDDDAFRQLVDRAMHRAAADDTADHR
jgi:hypothetical protein